MVVHRVRKARGKSKHHRHLTGGCLSKLTRMVSFFTMTTRGWFFGSPLRVQLHKVSQHVYEWVLPGLARKKRKHSQFWICDLVKLKMFVGSCVGDSIFFG